MRDMQLLERGWERNEQGLYREPYGEWMPQSEARVLAGLDVAPGAPQRITIRAFDLEGNTVTATIHVQGLITAGFETQLTPEERIALAAVEAVIAARLDQESRL